jgi:hypothetical protein
MYNSSDTHVWLFDACLLPETSSLFWRPTKRFNDFLSQHKHYVHLIWFPAEFRSKCEMMWKAYQKDSG